MKVDNKILNGYENMELIHYQEMPLSFANTHYFENLPNEQVSGVLKSNRYVDGKLVQTYSELENHLLIIAATRLGKTTQVVIPQIISFVTQKIKRSLVVSDPKGEIYPLLSSYLRENGYDVLLINLRDYMHSEYWNPLTDIFRKHQDAYNLEDEVEAVKTKDGMRNRFRGVIYENQSVLDETLRQMKDLLLADVDSTIDALAYSVIPPDDARDQYWNDSARQLFKALCWAMLEDSISVEGKAATINENTFSFNTLFTIMDAMTERDGYDTNEYFSGRGDESKAYNYSKVVLNNASGTRQCIVSCFYAKMSVFRNSTIRLITSCSSFELSRLTSDKPVAVFITYPDESKVYYQVISTFVQNAYTYLINYANEQPSGKLKVPFYFMLDEFGNFPKIPDFDSVISACGGRNIWFNLVLQSYAQLNNVYGRDIAEVIRDNLNIHMFLGSNNPATLKEFSEECGYTTRISPLSALNGSKGEIEQYNIETISLVPRSMLAKLKPGECIVTEANCGYVMFSRMERYYLCKEFSNFQLSSVKDYTCSINPLDKKYTYSFAKGAKKKGKYSFDF